MSDDIEYIEPTQEHVGQMVEVRDGKKQEWRKGKLIAIVDHEYGFIAQYPGYAWGACCKFARIARPLTYAERQARCGLKVGDRVKFVRAWDSDEYKLIDCDWVMRRDLIGTTGSVIDIANHINVRFPQHAGLSWWLPYFVLEKVEDRVATQNDCGATVYVDGTPQDEFRILVLWQEVDSVWRAVVRSGDKRFVYELSNLRVKE